MDESNSSAIGALAELVQSLRPPEEKKRMSNTTAKKKVTNSVRGKRNPATQEQRFRNFLKYTDPMLRQSDESTDASKLNDDLMRILNLGRLNQNQAEVNDEEVRQEFAEADDENEIRPPNVPKRKRNDGDEKGNKRPKGDDDDDDDDGNNAPQPPPRPRPAGKRKAGNDADNSGKKPRAAPQNNKRKAGNDADNSEKKPRTAPKNNKRKAEDVLAQESKKTKIQVTRKRKAEKQLQPGDTKRLKTKDNVEVWQEMRQEVAASTKRAKETIARFSKTGQIRGDLSNTAQKEADKQAAAKRAQTKIAQYSDKIGNDLSASSKLRR